VARVGEGEGAGLPRKAGWGGAAKVSKDSGKAVPGASFLVRGMLTINKTYDHILDMAGRSCHLTRS